MLILPSWHARGFPSPPLYHDFFLSPLPFACLVETSNAIDGSVMCEVEGGVLDRACPMVVCEAEGARLGYPILMICTPLGSYKSVAEAMAPGLAEGAIVTDVGSVKGSVIRDLTPILPETVHFIPGHPLAGTEHSGPESGFAELFEGRFCLLTPPPGADEAAVDRLTRLWQGMGSTVETIDMFDLLVVVSSESYVPLLCLLEEVRARSSLTRLC